MFLEEEEGLAGDECLFEGGQEQPLAVFVLIRQFGEDTRRILGILGYLVAISTGVAVDFVAVGRQDKSGLRITRKGLC